MEIVQYIKEQVFLPRIKKNNILVVYDPDKIYYELCLQLESESLKVVDASGNSIISREMAMKIFMKIGKQNTKVDKMLIYVPTKATSNDEEKLGDPFSIYSFYNVEGGTLFPYKDGDLYIELCKKCKPDYSAEITRIFKEKLNPSFAIIDAIGGSSGWPTLKTILRVDSAKDIIHALIVPNKNQKVAFCSQDNWFSEMKELLKTCIGLNLITKIKDWEAVSYEVWRFILFSEFVFDLPQRLPEALLNIPRAKEEAKYIILDICEQVRNDIRTQEIYIEKANAIEKELMLSEKCLEIRNLGMKDTFSFEERWSLQQTIDAFNSGNVDLARSIIKRQEDSIWNTMGESRAKWELLQATLNLNEKIADCEKEFPQNRSSLEDLLKFYVTNLREVDQFHREFEQNISDYIDDNMEIMVVIDQIRNQYYSFCSKTQEIFVRYIENAGWPQTGWLSNTEVFNKKVQPKLQESGRKVAYILVDALRYELGVALKNQLTDDMPVEIQPALAILPSITYVGMASLLPDSERMLFMKRQEDSYVLLYGDKKVMNVTQRMDIFRQKFGQRFQEMTLTEFVKKNGKVSEETEIFVLRSVEIDSQMEASPENAFSEIYSTFKRIRVALNKLSVLGFKDAIIATDHGFFLNTQTKAGNACSKPSGNWINFHERMLIGEGQGDAANYILSTEKMGIKGDCSQVAGPRCLVTYRSGQTYMHGGLSMQECIVPVLTINLEKEKNDQRKAEVTLKYKNGATVISTRLPVIDLAVYGDMFALINEEFGILIEAHDKNGNVVGEAKPSEFVNPATRTVAIKNNSSIKVTLKMHSEFEGKFTVKAMDPKTLLVYSKMELATDYLI